MPIRKLRLLSLVAATYFMVSGGPYGLEDTIGQAGYARTLLLLTVVPMFWSLPTALMVGELASAIPEEGGFYVWVTRGLGPFWGFQEAWLSLAAGLFDMATYPALTISYLSQLNSGITAGNRGLFWFLGIIVLCTVWNLRGAFSVGQASVWLSGFLLLPFAGIVLLGVWRAFTGPLSGIGSTRPGGDFRTALFVVLWNYMGWDNASTIAREVHNPQRNYIRSTLGALVLVAVSYIATVAAVASAGVSSAHFSTGDWVSAARLLAGSGSVFRLLSLTVVVGGALTGIAMLNALTLSYARVPAAMSAHGSLPAVFARHNRYGVPYVGVLACSVAVFCVCGLSFERLIDVDVLLYGLSLVLEFAALIALRIREPSLPRPYRIPGKLAGVIGLSLAPTLVVCWTSFATVDEQIAFGSLQINVLLLTALICASGVIGYSIRRQRKPAS